MRDALMTERSGPACIILRRVKSGRFVKSPFGPSHKPPRFGVPEEIRTPDPTLRSEVEPMNRRVPQYPYTFYCEILTQNSL